MISLIQSDPASPATLGTVNRLPLLSRLALRLARAAYLWQHRARSRRALMRLEAHELADIGLTRREARAEAAKWVWRG